MTLTYAVTDPHSGAVVQTYPTATARDVANALASTTQAYRGWSRARPWRSARR